jgi:hypothetical protein
MEYSVQIRGLPALGALAGRGLNRVEVLWKKLEKEN